MCTKVHPEGPGTEGHWSLRQGVDTNSITVPTSGPTITVLYMVKFTCTFSHFADALIQSDLK